MASQPQTAVFPRFFALSIPEMTKGDPIRELGTWNQELAKGVDGPSEAGRKPSSVPTPVTRTKVTVIHLGPPLPTGSSDYPENAEGAAPDP